MAKIFQITNAIRKIAADAIDDLIDQLGKDVRLVYPPTSSSCTCSPDLIGKKGPSIWSTGGPAPSSLAGTTGCPLCGGSGKQYSSHTDDIKLLCNIDIKTFENIKGIDVRLRQSGTVIQTKGYLADLPKILKCEYAVFQTTIEGVKQDRYELMSDPTDVNNIVPNRYFMALWKRVGG